MNDFKSKNRLISKAILFFASVLCLMVNASVHAAQFAYPQIEEASPANSYTPVNAATNVQAVDEGGSANDSDFTQTNTSTDTIEFNLTNTLIDPNVTNGHIIRARGQSNKSNTTVNLQLYQGGTQIADSGPLIVGKNAWLGVNYTLTAGEAGSITNYDDLRVRLVAQGSVSGQRNLWISWIEVEVPNQAALNPPTVDTPTFSAVTHNSATLGGTVSDDGGATVTDRGTVWGTSTNPTGNALSEGSGTGTFSHSRTGLPSNTLIYFRAYATNSQGTSYSANSSFTTDPAPTAPTVTTPTSADITDTTATLGGNVTDDGGDTITERGTVWGLSLDPEVGVDTKNIVAGTTGVFSGPVTGLPAGTLIHFRAYAINSVGTSYSTDATFTTLDLPTVTTPTSADITDTTATLGGNVTDDGGDTITERGTVWGLSLDPEVGVDTKNIVAGTTGVFSGPVTGLPAGTLIHFRAYAINSVGTSYSDDAQFTTNAGLPTVTTPTSADITDTTATLGGNVISDGGGAITERGTVWGLATNPEVGVDTKNIVAGTTGVFSGPVTGLPAGTLIHFRAYATNSAGTAYSTDATFTALDSPTVDTPTFSTVTDSSAVLGGTVSDDGGTTITDRGTLWGTSPSPTGNSQSEGSGTGAFTHTRNSLPSGTLIYFRAYATNSVGTSYSQDGSFTTLPTVSAPTFTDVTEVTAILGGTVASDGAVTVTARGTVWGTSPSPTGNILAEGSGNGTFTHERSGLPSGTLVYFRAYATNAGGTSYSEDGSFTTQAGATAPTVTSPTGTDVTATTATLGGNVTDNGGDPITERGTVWGLAANPEVGVDTKNIVTGTTGVFTGPVTGLNSGTQINYRAYATNSTGTGYSANDSFYTEPANSPASATIDTVTSGSFRILWPAPPAGDGDAAIVVVREGSAVSATPTDGTEHAFDSVFESGADLGTQQYVVYRGAGTSVIVTGLTDNTTYHVAVFYSAGTGSGASGINYKQTAPAVNNQLTDVGTLPPTVDTPTATSINYFSAVLGGTISSDGGATITERGTLWNTTGTPIIENKLAEGGTATGAFSHQRINMPKNTTIHYRAYATNADGTSYTQDATFVTAAYPDLQASNITFPKVGANSMRINWTKGNGVGNIVVLRLASTSRTNPSDGTDYVGNGDFSLATEIGGSQNYVVYNGTHNAIQVHGLSQLTNYTVAIYTYAGDGAEIAYLTPPAEASQATTDVPVHNMDYAPDCSHCHYHGSFGARDVEQEAICVTCHNESGPASAKLDFGLHLTPGYAADDVDCGSCHELHNPNGATTATHTLSPFTTTTNKSFIRSNVDKYVSTAAPGKVALYQTPITDLAIEDGDATTARGICQSCHTQVGNHRHDGTGDQCHDGGGGNCDPITNGGTDCLACHTHVDNFAASGGGCTGCHSSTQGGAPPLDRREIVSEFSRLTHHVGGPLADSDCQVCHQQSATDHNHQDGSLTLWNVDSHGTAGDYQLSDHSDPNTDVTEAAVLTPFCLNCHDSDGAQAEASPLAPFTGSGVPPDIQTTWTVSSHATVSQTANGSSQPTTCLGDGAFGCHGTGHGSEKLNLLTPANLAASAPDFSEQREGFCLNCHTTNGASSIDIHAQLGGLATDFQEDGNNGNGAPINQKHDILPADQTYSGAAVTCSDCHEPHIATDANPNIDPDTGSMFTNSYNKGSSYTDDGYNWTYDSGGNLDPTNPIGGSAYSEPDTIEFCLTCHDGTTPPGVTMSPGMINIATSYQVDYHGRGDAGSAGNGDFKPPWVATVGDEPGTPYAALNCTVCHDSHGSGNIYHLKESITIGNEPAQEVGGWSGDTIGSLSGTTYTLPLTGGVQVDHDWGGWCSFCHDMQAHKVDEDKACRTGHMHGGGAF